MAERYVARNGITVRHRTHFALLPPYWCNYVAAPHRTPFGTPSQQWVTCGAASLSGIGNSTRHRTLPPHGAPPPIARPCVERAAIDSIAHWARARSDETHRAGKARAACNTTESIPAAAAFSRDIGPRPPAPPALACEPT